MAGGCCTGRFVTPCSVRFGRLYCTTAVPRIVQSKPAGPLAGATMYANTSRVFPSTCVEPGQYHFPDGAGMRSVHWFAWPPSFGRRQVGSWKTRLLCTSPALGAELFGSTVPTCVSLIHHEVRPSGRSAGTYPSAWIQPVLPWVSRSKSFWYADALA